MGEAEERIAARNRRLKEEAEALGAAVQARLAVEVHRLLPLAVKSLKKRGYPGSQHEPQMWQGEPRAVWLLHQWSGSGGRTNASGGGTYGVSERIYLLADGTLIVHRREGSTESLKLFPLPTADTSFLTSVGVAESLCRLVPERHRHCERHTIRTIEREERARLENARRRSKLLRLLTGK